MKVLFWVNHFPMVSETFIRNQIIDLIDQDIEVKIFCYVKNRNSQGLEGFEEYDLSSRTIDFFDLVPQSKIQKVFSCFKILVNSLFKSNLLYYLNFIKSFFKDQNYSFRYFFIMHYILQEKIEVVHCHFGPLGKDAVFLKKIGLPIKLICTFHGYDIRLGVKEGHTFYSDLFRYADSIISISSYNKEMLSSFGLQQEKIIELNNGVEVIAETRKESHTKEEIVNILSVGRLVEEKGYELAIKTISLFHNNNPELRFHYDIIGGGKLEKKIKKMCSDLNLDSLITFHLSQNSQFVKNKMRSADLFLLTSINEAIPTVILEAQSYSLPVIATNVGSVKDLVIDDVTGFLSSPTETDLENCLQKMFDNKDRWEIYGANAKQNISLNFDRRRLVQKLIKIYKT